MPSKSDEKFFEKKKEWSRRKDQILSHYLVPYLARIKKRNKPILLVDGFAGKGKFDDGSPGSPLIICGHAEKAIEDGARVEVLCAEPNPDWHKALEQNVADFKFVGTRCCSFIDCMEEVEEKAKNHSVFIYADPYATEGIEWAALNKVFAHLKESNSSIEILMNFNAVAFARRGLAALKRDLPPVDLIAEDVVDDLIDENLSAQRINDIVGGDWWKDSLDPHKEFPEQVEAVAQGMLGQLSNRFAYTCMVPLKKEEGHAVPAYYMVFASRNDGALILMNDRMIRAKHAGLFTMDLFASVDLAAFVLELAEERIPRKEIYIHVMKKWIATFEEKEIKECIKGLLKEGRLESETRRIRINDNNWVLRQNPLC